MALDGTVAASWGFDPVVWSDHAMAYFRTKLVFGALAYKEDNEGKARSDLHLGFLQHNWRR